MREKWLLSGPFRLLENYCFVLLTNRVPPQISDNRPDMRNRALFVTSRAAWRWNVLEILLKQEILYIPVPLQLLNYEHLPRDTAPLFTHIVKYGWKQTIPRPLDLGHRILVNFAW